MREQSEKTRQKIISSARYIFIRRGYLAATITEISKKANITRRTIYGYFSSKREIFLEVIKDAVGISWGFVDLDHNVTTEQELYDQLYQIAVALNDVFSNNGYIELIRIIIAEVNMQPELSDAMTNGVTSTSRNIVKQLFTYADKNNVISVKEPAVLADLFTGVFVLHLYTDGLIQQKPGKIHSYTEDELSRYVQRFIQTGQNNLHDGN